MADEDFTPEELELLDQIIADVKAINRLLSNSASVGEKNSGAKSMRVKFTPFPSIPSETEVTMVMEPHEHLRDDYGDNPKPESLIEEQKDDQIEDLVDESLDLVKTKWAVQVTYFLNNGGLGTVVRDQLLQPFVPINQQTKCTSSTFVPGVFISNCLLDLYTKCESLVDAQKVFDEMGNRDLCPHWVIMMGLDSIEQSMAQTEEPQLRLLKPVTPRLPPKPPDVSFGTMGESNFFRVSGTAVFYSCVGNKFHVGDGARRINDTGPYAFSSSGGKTINVENILDGEEESIIKKKTKMGVLMPSLLGGRGSLFRTSFVDENVDTVSSVEAELAHLRRDSPANDALKSGSVFQVSYATQNIGQQTTYTYATALGSSLSRSSTPDPQLVARAPSPCPTPISNGRDRVVTAEKRGISSPDAFTDVSPGINDSADIVAALSGMHLSDDVLDGDNHFSSKVELDVDNHQGFLFGMQDGQDHGNLHAYLTKFELGKRSGNESDINNPSLDRQDEIQKSTIPPSNSYFKGSPTFPFSGIIGLLANYQPLDVTNYGLSGYVGNPALASLMANQFGTGNMPPLFENVAATSAMAGMDSRILGGGLAPGVAVPSDVHSLDRMGHQIAGGAPQALFDPAYLQYLRTSEYAAAQLAALTDPSVDQNYLGNFFSECHVPDHKAPLDLTLTTSMWVVYSSSANWIHRSVLCGTMPFESQNMSVSKGFTVLHSWIYPQSVLPSSLISVLSSSTAGSRIGPGGLGFVSEMVQVEKIAQFSVIFVFFALEFPTTKLKVVRAVAILGAMLLKFLMERNSINAIHGKVTIGTLILQGCAVGLLFVLLPVLGGTSGVLQGVRSITKSLLILITIFAILSILSSTWVPWLLKLIISLSSQTNELYQPAAVTLCLLVAWCSDKLGTFAAGVMISTIDFGQHMLEQVEPICNFLLLCWPTLGCLYIVSGLDQSHATWEDHSIILEAFPHFNLEDKVIFNGGGIVTSTNNKEMGEGAIGRANEALDYTAGEKHMEADPYGKELRESTRAHVTNLVLKDCYWSRI